MRVEGSRKEYIDIQKNMKVVEERERKVTAISRIVCRVCM